MSRTRRTWLALAACLLAARAAAAEPGPVIALRGAALAGGTAVTVPEAELPGSVVARRVEGPSGGPASAMHAVFEWPGAPAGAVALSVKGRSVHGSAVSQIEILINGRRIVRGPAPFAREWWEIRSFPIPVGALRPGANRLEIRSLDAGGERGIRSVLVAECTVAPAAHVPVHELTTGFTVDLPADPGPAPPGPVPAGPNAFRIRGTKGWGWTPEQYISEIPWLARFGLNFLMNGYTSMYSDAEKRINRWWEPIPDEKKRAFEEIARQSRLNGIEFCFAFHPQLHSERPLKLDDEADFETLWRQYEWMQRAGVNWFSLCFDDIPTRGLDMPALAEGQARVANKLLARLRQAGPDAQLIVCPVTYYGCGAQPAVRPYLEALGRTLAEDIYVFWTGDESVAPSITRACAGTFQSSVRRRLFLWDNYPTNDRTPVLHLGPVTGRDAALAGLAGGYLSNPHAPQHDVNRLPLSTCADFASDPDGYDPRAAIARAIQRVARTPGQRDVLARLVELYPGELVYGRNQPNENLLVERFTRLLEWPDGQAAARALVLRAERALEDLERLFPGQFETTKDTLRGHVGQMRARVGAAR